METRNSGEKRKVSRRSSKRSSILKQRDPLVELEQVEDQDDTTRDVRKAKRNSKRVSFSGTKRIKLFLKDTDLNEKLATVQPNSYEKKDEVFNQTVHDGVDMDLTRLDTDFSMVQEESDESDTGRCFKEDLAQAVNNSMNITRLDESSISPNLLFAPSPGRSKLIKNKTITREGLMDMSCVDLPSTDNSPLVGDSTLESPEEESFRKESVKSFLASLGENSHDNRNTLKSSVKDFLASLQKDSNDLDAKNSQLASPSSFIDTKQQQPFQVEDKVYTGFHDLKADHKMSDVQTGSTTHINNKEIRIDVEFEDSTDSMELTGYISKAMLSESGEQISISEILNNISLSKSPTKKACIEDGEDTPSFIARMRELNPSQENNEEFNGTPKSSFKESKKMSHKINLSSPDAVHLQKHFDDMQQQQPAIDLSHNSGNKQSKTLPVYNSAKSPLKMLSDSGAIENQGLTFNDYIKKHGKPEGFQRLMESLDKSKDSPLKLTSNQIPPPLDQATSPQNQSLQCSTRKYIGQDPNTIIEPVETMPPEVSSLLANGCFSGSSQFFNNIPAGAKVHNISDRFDPKLSYINKDNTSFNNQTILSSQETTKYVSNNEFFRSFVDTRTTVCQKPKINKTMPNFSLHNEDGAIEESRNIQLCDVGSSAMVTKFMTTSKNFGCSENIDQPVENKVIDGSRGNVSLNQDEISYNQVDSVSNHIGVRGAFVPYKKIQSQNQNTEQHSNKLQVLRSDNPLNADNKQMAREKLNQVSIVNSTVADQPKDEELERFETNPKQQQMQSPIVTCEENVNSVSTSKFARPSELKGEVQEAIQLDYFTVGKKAEGVSVLDSTYNVQQEKLENSYGNYNKTDEITSKEMQLNKTYVLEENDDLGIINKEDKKKKKDRRGTYTISTGNGLLQNSEETILLGSNWLDEDTDFLSKTLQLKNPIANSSILGGKKTVDDYKLLSDEETDRINAIPQSISVETEKVKEKLLVDDQINGDSNTLQKTQEKTLLGDLGIINHSVLLSSVVVQPKVVQKSMEDTVNSATITKIGSTKFDLSTSWLTKDAVSTTINEGVKLDNLRKAMSPLNETNPIESLKKPADDISIVNNTTQKDLQALSSHINTAISPQLSSNDEVMSVQDESSDTGDDKKSIQRSVLMTPTRRRSSNRLSSKRTPNKTIPESITRIKTPAKTPNKNPKLNLTQTPKNASIKIYNKSLNAGTPTLRRTPAREENMKKKTPLKNSSKKKRKSILMSGRKTSVTKKEEVAEKSEYLQETFIDQSDDMSGFISRPKIPRDSGDTLQFSSVKLHDTRHESYINDRIEDNISRHDILCVNQQNVTEVEDEPMENNGQTEEKNENDNLSVTITKNNDLESLLQNSSLNGCCIDALTSSSLSCTFDEWKYHKLMVTFTGYEIIDIFTERIVDDIFDAEEYYLSHMENIMKLSSAKLKYKITSDLPTLLNDITKRIKRWKPLFLDIYKTYHGYLGQVKLNENRIKIKFVADGKKYRSVFYLNLEYNINDNVPSVKTYLEHDKLFMILNQVTEYVTAQHGKEQTLLNYCQLVSSFCDKHSAGGIDFNTLPTRSPDEQVKYDVNIY